ncbi:hypothetical protein D3C78_1090740 [compost metagenome]
MLAADQVTHRHPHVVEEHFVDVVTAIKGDDRTHADPGALHVDQQERDTALSLGLGVGTHQTEHPVGQMRCGGPGFLAVDHIKFTLAHRASIEAGQVRTGTRLGIALAPPVFAGQDARQEVGLLLGRTKLADHRPDHVDAERDDPRRPGPAVFFIENMLLHGCPAGAAVLHWPTGRQPPLVIESAHPGNVVGLGDAFAVANPLGQCLGQVLLKKRAHFVAKRELIASEMDIHLKPR